MSKYKNLSFKSNFYPLFIWFRDPTQQERIKYGELLTLDLSYFSGKNDELVSDFTYIFFGDIFWFYNTIFLFTFQFEKKLEGNDALKSADEELKESHVELLSRFYKLFESVHRYFIDLNSYLQDLDDGRFIQTSLESVFLDMDGKQLLVRNT